MMAATGRLADRFGRMRLLLTLHLVRGAALVLAASCTSTGLLFGFAVLFGVSSFPIIPLTVATLSAGRAPAALGRVLGRVWLLHQGCAAAGVLAGGLTRSLTGTYRPYFLAAAALMAASSLLVWRLAAGRDSRPPGTPATASPAPVTA
jgi:MFS family permease